MTISSLRPGFRDAPGAVDVERAIAEIRSGRPILLRDGAEPIVALACEALDGDLAARFDLLARGEARLALPAPRLRCLGADRRDAGAIVLPVVDIARAQGLAFDPAARLDAPVASIAPLEEGALELMRLAQVLPAAIVGRGDGAKTIFPNLLGVALDDVQSFSLARHASLRIVSRARVPLEGAPESEFVVFRGGEGLRDQVAIVIGAPDFSAPVPVRLHSACLTGDLVGSLKCDCGDQLRYAVRHMAESGGGVLLYLDQEGRGNGLANKIRAYDLQAQGLDTYHADETLGFGPDQRRFAFAAEMLKALGARHVRLLTNNPEKIRALAEAGLEDVEAERLLGRRNTHNLRYLAAKRDKAGHLIDLDCAPR